MGDGRIERLAVLGGGTMGAGIAQLGALAGARTTIVDPYADLEALLARIAADLAKGAERGRWSAEDAERATALLDASAELEAVADADAAIEAITEDLAAKHELLGAVERLTGPDCVLATNTSSLPVGAIAAGLADPSRLVGMHFFNPAPLMPLVEVVAGAASSETALERIRELGEAMGRRVILTTDTPGFLVNRCNRPFMLEALEAIREGLAGPEEVDRAVRLGGGFRMGPCELQDLVGLDVGLAVARSFAANPGAEKRWQPSPLLAEMVEQGRLGRKAGRGWYEYPPGRPADPDPPAPGELPGVVAIEGESAIAADFRALAGAAGWQPPAGDAAPDLAIDLRIEPGPPLAEAPTAVLLASSSLAARAAPGAVGFHALPPLGVGGLVEVCTGPETAPASRAAFERFLAACGLRAEPVGDAPGLVLGRIVAQLVNEASFANEEGVGSAADIDAGMELGMGHPRGPMAWAELIGPGHVVAILDGLGRELDPERYRVSPSLRERADR